MKITIIGALGNIGKPLTKNLVAKGHQVIGIDYKTESSKQIIDLGAFPAIGDLDNIEFLMKNFEGADAVFTMFPPVDYLNPALDLIASYKRRSENYASAILEAKVQRVVNLSSVGAHLERGNGMVKGAFYVEKILNALPPEVSITHIRSTSLYTNLYGYMNTIKAEGKIYATFGSDSMPWASPIAVAEAVAEELTQIFTGRNNRYVVSEELTGDEVAAVLGKAIEKPDLIWQQISDEELENKLKSAGVNSIVAAELTEMYAALGSGLMAEDYRKNKPQNMGKVKLTHFAKDFAKAYYNYH